MVAGSPGALKSPAREDHVLWRLAVAIGKTHVGVAEHDAFAASRDAMRFNQCVPGFAAMRAGVHAQRAADTTGNAPKEGQSVDSRLCGGAGDLDVGNRRANRDEVAFPHGDAAKALR